MGNSKDLLLSSFVQSKIDPTHLKKIKGGEPIRILLGDTATGKLYQWIGYDGDRPTWGAYEIQYSNGTSSGMIGSSQVIANGDHV